MFERFQDALGHLEEVDLVAGEVKWGKFMRLWGETRYHEVFAKEEEVMHWSYVTGLGSSHL